jgi:hypothetical protein
VVGLGPWRSFPSSKRQKARPVLLLRPQRARKERQNWSLLVHKKRSKLDNCTDLKQMKKKEGAALSRAKSGRQWERMSAEAIREPKSCKQHDPHAFSHRPGTNQTRTAKGGVGLGPWRSFPSSKRRKARPELLSRPQRARK